MATMEEVSKKLNLYLIRHAESKNNELYDKISDGPDFEEIEGKHREADCGLSRLGIEQAELLGRCVTSGGGSWQDILAKDYDIYSSPMKRCLLTAQAIRTSSAVTKDVRVYRHLYESGGSYDTVDGNTIGVAGTTEADVLQQYPGFVCEEGMENGWYLRSEKETMSEFDQRSNAVVEWLWGKVGECTSEHPTRSIVLVTHGNLMSAILNGLLFGDGVTRSGLFIHSNTGMSHLELVEVPETKKRVCSMQYLNHTPHLELNPAQQSLSSESDSSQKQLRTGHYLFKNRWIHEFL